MMTAVVPSCGDLAALSALAAIEDAVRGSCMALADRDEAGALAAFAAGARCEHGSFAGTAPDYVAAALAGALPGVSPRSWQVTSHGAGLSGAGAWAETYVMADAPHGAADMMAGLRLLDRLAREGDTWRITSRRTLLDWTFRWPHGTPDHGERK